MKFLTLIVAIMLISGCAVASLAGTVVSTTVKVVEVPFKIVGSVIDDNDEEEDNLRAILPQATAILKEWNLFVNEDKTDFTHVYLARTGEVDSDGNPLSGNEAWRKSITLRSALCSKADIQRRIKLGYAAFNN